MGDNLKESWDKANVPGSKEHISATFITAIILGIAAVIFAVIEAISR
jgi:hypothetical protein